MAALEARREPPRALCLQQDDVTLVIGKLARACLSFQESFLTKPRSPAGLLCQAWMPVVVEDNQIVLKTKNMPFAVAGMGDLLALFRCISCRFAFGTNVTRPATLGAPGRVYTSSEPEMCCNVQHYAKGAYLRKAEAEQCQVQSTLLLPLFISPRRSGCVGVLEVVQTSEDMAFADVAALLAGALEKCDLFTCDMNAVRRHAPHAAHTHSVLLPPQTGVLLPPDTSSEPQGSGEGRSGGAVAMQDDAGGGRGGGGGAESEDFSADDGEDDEDSDGDTRRGGRQGRSGRSGRRKGTGNPGKPGVRLTMEDLQSQFGVGLKEAAARLGICPTTLKRACRRHGIQRWPRRQLQKVNRALDEMEARQLLQTQQHLAAPLAAGATDAFGGPLNAGDDSRWTTLAHFIPAYNNAAVAGAGNAGMFGGLFSGQEQGVQQQQQQQSGLLAFTAQQQQQQQQQQQLGYQQQLLAAAAAAGAGMQQAPTQSNAASLPDGVLAMGCGGATGPATIVEVSTVSGVSSLGQPPPQGRGQQQQQQRREPHPAATTAAQPQRQHSGSSSGGAPRAAEYLQRVAAASHYVSPFLPATAGRGGAPIVQLPGGGGSVAGHGAAGVDRMRLSAISVPSLPADVMPSLAMGLGGSTTMAGLPGGMNGMGGGALGGMRAAASGSPRDDDQVGFLDSSVLELLLTEEQRGGGGNGMPKLGLGQNGMGQNGLGQNGLGQNGLGQNGLGQNGLGQNGLGQNGVGVSNGGGGANGGATTSYSAGDLLLPNIMPMPGMSNGGMSGLSFMI